MARKFRKEQEEFNDLAVQYEMFACAMLDECNTVEEAERILREPSYARPSHVTKLSNCPSLFDFAQETPQMMHFINSKWFQRYAEGVWVGRSLFKPSSALTRDSNITHGYVKQVEGVSA